MKRKVIQIAESTQLISLPRAWCKEQQLKRGDELEVEILGKKLLISTEASEQGLRVEVEVSKLDRTSLILLIRGLYKKGYDEIKLNYARPVVHHFRLKKDVNISALVHREVNRCPGLEVIEQKDTYCLLKVISNANPKEFDHVLRRTFILISDACHDLTQACKLNDRVALESIEEKHDNITRFLNHSLRLIQRRHEDHKNAEFLYLTVSILDKIVDILLSVSRDVLQYGKKVSGTTTLLLESMGQSYTTFYDLFYSFSQEKICKMNELKEIVHEAMMQKAKKIPKEELLVLYTMHQSLELYRALTEARMAMEY